MTVYFNFKFSTKLEFVYCKFEFLSNVDFIELKRVQIRKIVTI
jgi:hypothetical protein